MEATRNSVRSGHAPLHWFMTSNEWTRTIFVAVAAAVLLMPFYLEISLWVGFGILVSVIMFVNIPLVSRFIIPLPQIIVMVACIQLILAAWGNQYYPSHKPHFDIGSTISEYLSYAGPAVAALMLGLFVPLWGIHGGIEYSRPTMANARYARRLVKELKILFIAGIVARVFEGAAPGSLSFFMALAGLLSYVALFGLMFYGVRNWERYAAILLSIELLFALTSGSFHGLLLWGMIFVLVLSNIRKWGVKTLRIMLVGLFAILLLQAVKQVYRDHFWYGESTGYSQSRVVAFVEMTADVLMEPGKLFNEQHIADTLVRLNQGWIVNRVMIWTPRYQPYAEGETLVRSVQAIVPRVLMPGKASTAGRVDFERYTGHTLWKGTSMGLGYAGEMYANFGHWGGVLGVGIYGLLLGLGFRFIYKMAKVNPLWWAWGAYFFLIAVKAETTVGFVLNWSVKAVIVMALVLLVSPAMRHSLFPQKGSSR
ncbi:hypothetical protein ACFL00_00185 [Pseudomonadota bacterium]